MKRFSFLNKDYFKLFALREGKVVLGNRKTNLWLLTIVLFATFLAIAFSSGSLRYLYDKMNDPFINWVDIKNDYGKGDFVKLSEALEDDALKEQYHYRGYQSDYYFSWMFFGKQDNQVQYLRCRFFGDINSALIEAILADDNIADGCRVADLSEVDPNTVGVIVTEEMIHNLGYEKPYPAYIDYQRYNPDAAELGFKVVDKFVRLPLPVLGVVRRLPGNVDLISTKNCYFQDINDITYPFSYSDNPEYAASLYYYVPDDLGSDVFMDEVRTLLDEMGCEDISVEDSYFYKPEIVPYKPGSFVSITSDDGEIPCDLTAEIADRIAERFAGDDVHRVFDFNFTEYRQSKQAYISVHFKDLDKVGDFQEYVKENFRVNIEMTQINAKRNFNAVSIMANILSWAMIFFAITCIVLFIINLLQSYFQKVKRNIGTFKAFGISNRELIGVYTLIIFLMVAAAVVIALAAVLLVQLLAPVFGLLKEGYNLLDLGNPKTVISILVILAASVVTVHWVMQKMLRNTPGDLIYDR